MSDMPPNIDAILASIRSRMNEGPEHGVPDDGDTPPLAAAAPAPVEADIGQMVVEAGGPTLDGLVRSMLAPMLQAWLDANMPEIVERLAQAEIKRLTGKG